MPELKVSNEVKMQARTMIAAALIDSHAVEANRIEPSRAKPWREDTSLLLLHQLTQRIYEVIADES